MDNVTTSATREITTNQLRTTASYRDEIPTTLPANGSDSWMSEYTQGTLGMSSSGYSSSEWTTRDSLNSTDDNGWTREVCITTQEISLLINVVAIVGGLVIILGNFLVLFVLFRYPSKRFMPFNWLLCHLAVADLGIGFTTFWWFGVAEILQTPVTLNQKVIAYGVSIVAVLASFEGLMMIALDRYLLILQQRRYTTILTRKRIAIAIVIMWIVPSLVQIVGPIAGWSCVDSCDCRIQNARPDDPYCFGETCSQMLPPLTKEQLLVASIYSFILFLITVLLYIRIFYGIRKKSRLLQKTLSEKRSTETSGISPDIEIKRSIPTDELKIPSVTVDLMRNRRRGEWRHNLTTVEEQETVEHQPAGMRFSTFNKAFENDDLTPNDDSANSSLPNESDKSSSIQQEEQHKRISTITNSSSSGEKIELPIRNDPQIATAVVIYRKPQFAAESPTENPVESSPTLSMRMRPKAFTTQRQKSDDSRKSLTQNVMSTFNRITRKRGRGRRRSSASRKRDVRVMRSMFIIMSVFMVTTAPLMFFLVYTYGNNDRTLKEIFNPLLQITTINSLLNPFLYFCRIPAMKAKLSLLVHAQYWRRKWNEKIARWRKKVPPAIDPYRNVSSPVSELSESWESGPSESHE